MNLRFMKAGTSDALVLNSISRQAFDSDVEVGAASPGGPPGYQSVSFHIRMARMNLQSTHESPVPKAGQSQRTLPNTVVIAPIV